MSREKLFQTYREAKEASVVIARETGKSISVYREGDRWAVSQSGQSFRELSRDVVPAAETDQFKRLSDENEALRQQIASLQRSIQTSKCSLEDLNQSYVTEIALLKQTQEEKLQEEKDRYQKLFHDHEVRKERNFEFEALALQKENAALTSEVKSLTGQVKHVRSRLAEYAAASSEEKQCADENSVKSASGICSRCNGLGGACGKCGGTGWALCI